MSQASEVIAKFGSAYRLATLLSQVSGRKVYLYTVSRWRKPRDRGGTGGVIPAWWHHAIVAAAKREGIELGSEDFFVVRQETEHGQ